MSSNSALLVIDVQPVILNRVHQPQQLLTKLQTLLDKARQTETPIIFLQHEDDDWIGLSEAEIHGDIQPQAEDRVIVKRASDSFYQTPLEDELKAQGITHLVVTGLRTERCVDTTARVAVSKGFDVTLVTDAHSTADGDHLTAEQIIVHTNYNLDEFGNDDHEIELKTTEEVAF